MHCAFCTQQCSCTYEPTTALTAHTRPVQHRARHIPSIKGGGQEVHLQAEGLLASDGCWHEKSQFSLRMSPPSLEASHVPVDGLTSMHMLAAPSGLCDFEKESEHMRLGENSGGGS